MSAIEAPSKVFYGNKWFRSPKGNWYRPGDNPVTAFYSRRDAAWKLVIGGQFGKKTFPGEGEAMKYAETVLPKIAARK